MVECHVELERKTAYFVGEHVSATVTFTNKVNARNSNAARIPSFVRSCPRMLPLHIGRAMLSQWRHSWHTTVLVFWPCLPIGM